MLQDFPMYAYIPATDLQRARRFYEGTLGFEPAREANGGVIYEFAGGTSCFLYPTPNAGTSRASQAYWQVRGLERLVGELRSRGVTFEEYFASGQPIVVDGGAKAAWFKDSEGNIMALIETI